MKAKVSSKHLTAIDRALSVHSKIKSEKRNSGSTNFQCIGSLGWNCNSESSIANKRHPVWVLVWDAG